MVPIQVITPPPNNASVMIPITILVVKEFCDTTTVATGELVAEANGMNVATGDSTTNVEVETAASGVMVSVVIKVDVGVGTRTPVLINNF